MRNDHLPGPKRSVDLSLEGRLIDEARSLDIDVPVVVESALKREIAAEKARRWREENAVAIMATNARIERDGLWCDEYRLF